MIILHVHTHNVCELTAAAVSCPCPARKPNSRPTCPHQARPSLDFPRGCCTLSASLLLSPASRPTTWCTTRTTVFLHLVRVTAHLHTNKDYDRESFGDNRVQQKLAHQPTWCIYTSKSRTRCMPCPKARSYGIITCMLSYDCS